MKKKLLSFLLCLALVATTLPACNSEDTADSGNTPIGENSTGKQVGSNVQDAIEYGIIKSIDKDSELTFISEDSADFDQDFSTILFGKMPETIDPQKETSSFENNRVTSLIFEGLYSLDKDGNLINKLCESATYAFNDMGLVELEFKLKDSCWSDGVPVTAYDFVTSWKKLLLPNYPNFNASLLYPVLNAKAVKEGNMTFDNAGIWAKDDKTLVVVLCSDYANENDSEDEIYSKVNYFARRLSSPVFIPLREDILTPAETEKIKGQILETPEDIAEYINESHWSQPNDTHYVTNGPFAIESFNSGKFSLTRNKYYRNAAESGKHITKPKDISSSYYSDDYFEVKSHDIVNINALTLESIDINARDITLSSKVPSTYMLYLDCNAPLFANEDVRKALSLALDREELANITSCTPSEGYVPFTVEGKSHNSEYRSDFGSLIDSDSNIEEAKKLFNSSELDERTKNTKIFIDYNDDSYTERRIAEYCNEAWSKLGLTVIVAAKAQKFIDSKYSGKYPLNQTHERGLSATVVIGMNSSNSPDAYSILSRYSSDYSIAKHVTGFYDEEYEKMFDNAAKAETDEERASLMFEAEKYLISKMPAIPVLNASSNYIIKDGVLGVCTDFYGSLNLTELTK